MWLIGTIYGTYDLTNKEIAFGFPHTPTRYKPPPPAAGNHTKRVRGGTRKRPKKKKKLTVENDQLVLHRNSTESRRLFRVREGNNPFEGDFHVGIVERCTQFLGVVGWR